MECEHSSVKNTKGANKHCCYGVCNSDSRYNFKDHMQGVFFIPFPKPKTNEEKSRRWLAACGREHFTVDKIRKWTYICSKHFIGGNGPTDEHPDPIPATYIPAQVQRYSRKRKAPTPRAEPVSKRTLFEASEALVLLQNPPQIDIQETVVAEQPCEASANAVFIETANTSEQPEIYRATKIIDKGTQTQFSCSDQLATKIDKRILQNKKTVHKSPENSR